MSITEQLAMRWRVLDEHKIKTQLNMLASYPYRQPQATLASRYSQQVPGRQEKEKLKEADLEEQG